VLRYSPPNTRIARGWRGRTVSRCARSTVLHRKRSGKQGGDRLRPVKSIAFCVGLFLALCGCSALFTLRRDDREQEAEKQPARPDLGKVERIELSACAAPGIPALVPYIEVVLDRLGCCRETIVVDGKVTAAYDLPEEVFDECRGLLAEVDFFRMKSSTPEVP